MSRNKSSYQGQFLGGAANGYGVEKLNKITYEGKFIDGIKSGNGLVIFPNGDRFLGYFEKDRKSRGKMTQKDGTEYYCTW